MKRDDGATLLLLVALAVAILWFHWKYDVTPGAATVKAGKGVTWKDPCPGAYQVWDAETERCVPLATDEPVPPPPR